eukprot:TRINITY_DN15115_c0_g5_i1.p1 TRINITY_DN15115_c0_g5~~TRINITY_DN15115_c0_g5_i1.p1  ORF type:complete len:204 (-),score=37.54 TRINITY_DN15115_c0_g5_i1:66-677(-)
MEFLDSDEGTSYVWKLGNFNGPGYRKCWGVVTDLRLRHCSAPIRPLPDIFRPLAARMRQVIFAAGSKPKTGYSWLQPSKVKTFSLENFQPNEANAIDYRREEGHHLLPHCDDRQLSGEILCNLCLCGDAVMTYVEDSGRGKKRCFEGAAKPERYEVMLPRRALQIQSGRVRYEFRHGIYKSGLLGPRRVSITFRQTVYSGHNI